MFEPAELALLADVKEAEDAHIYGQEIQLEEKPESPCSEEAKKFGHIMSRKASWKYRVNKWVAGIVKRKDDAHQNDGDDILDRRFEDRWQYH